MAQPSDPAWGLRIEPAEHRVQVREVLHLHELEDDELCVIGSAGEVDRLVSLIRVALGTVTR